MGRWEDEWLVVGGGVSTEGCATAGLVVGLPATVTGQVGEGSTKHCDPRSGVPDDGFGQ